jgi:hypothetical protein
MPARNRAPRVEPVRQLVSVDEFARHAGCSKRTIWRWIADDLLPVYWLAATGVRPGMVRLDLRDLDRVVTRERVAR